MEGFFSYELEMDEWIMMQFNIGDSFDEGSCFLLTI